MEPTIKRPKEGAVDEVLDPDEIVKALESIQPEQVDYAELVGAPVASAYGCCYVWDSPEPYIIQNGIDLIKQQQGALAADHARIAELEAEVVGLRANSIIQEKVIEAGRSPLDKSKIVGLTMENAALQSQCKEAMELLAITSKHVPRRCSYCKHFKGDFNYDPCGSCGVSECSVYIDDRTCKSGSFKWVRAARYEALKAQVSASEKNRE